MPGPPWLGILARFLSPSSPPLVTLTQLVNSSKAKHKGAGLPGCFSYVLLAFARLPSQAACWLSSVITARGFVWKVPCGWLIYAPPCPLSSSVSIFTNLWCGDGPVACKIHVLCVCLHVCMHLHVWVGVSLWVYTCSGECGGQQSVPGDSLHELSLRLLETGLFTGPRFINEAGLAGPRASESHCPHLPRSGMTKMHCHRHIQILVWQTLCCVSYCPSP